MRWILVILLLYLIPLVILFKNNKNFKRACTYASIYTVLSSIILISNIYISKVNNIRDMVYYNSYAADEVEPKKEDVPKDKKSVEIDTQSPSEEKEIIVNDESVDKIEEEPKSTLNIETNKKEIKDSDLVFEFKSEVYDIEKVALIPMRECVPNAKAFLENASNLKEIKKEVIDAQQKCEEVVETYEALEIPELDKEEYEKKLYEAKIDVQKAYILRGKAMESGVSFINTKNPKYLGEVKEYMELSDEYIKNFVQKVKIVETKVE